MKEPFYKKCNECDSDFACFVIHASSDQKETIIIFAGKEGWRQQQKALSEHQSRASKARHAKRTPEERSAYAKMMVEAREAKRAHKNISTTRNT